MRSFSEVPLLVDEFLRLIYKSKQIISYLLCPLNSYVYKKRGFQSFPYENPCEYYKKLVSRSWLLLFTLTYFFLNKIRTPHLLGKKVVVVAVFLSRLDHRPLFSDIYDEAILV